MKTMKTAADCAKAGCIWNACYQHVRSEKDVARRD